MAKQEKTAGHMPLGYKIVNGKAEIEPDSAKIVRKIFKSYLAGVSTYRIAKELTEQGVLNASHRPSWNHGSVGKILENQKYKGDAFYPKMISTSVFEQVQERRREKARQLGREAQLNSFANLTAIGSRMVCGVCGQPYRKYVEHCNQPGEIVRWKCKRYIKGNRVYCRNRFLTEDEIQWAFLAVINRVIASPTMLEQADEKRSVLISGRAERMNQIIGEIIQTGQYDSETIKNLLYERAAAQYRFSSIDDRAYQTEKMKKALSGKSQQTDFDEQLFQQTVKTIIVQRDGHLEFELANGLRLKERIEEKQKKGAYIDAASNEKEYFRHPGETSV